MINMNKMSIENQRIHGIFLAPRKDLGVGWWCLDNPYGLRILNPFKYLNTIYELDTSAQ